ncbi:MAG TPA: MlaD family protein [Solirubrobacteraceae bacterium]|nr:MlaD family protein [Solirubrobacteraceae bacterium]
MSRRRSSSSIVANPVLVGAVTTLVVLVAVFLAYNANNGLPFVPTRQYKVQLDNGSNLVRGNEVRAGGFRVGVVESLRPITLTNGRTVAELTLKLDKKTGDVPVDSTATIRPRSALGLKFVQITKGHSSRTFHDGDTIPLAHTTVPVQFDDLNKLFDTKTRQASQDNLVGFGNAFTGRGQDLNVTINQLPQLFYYLEPVARNLSSGDTQLARFFRELGRTAAIVAPVAGVNARLFTDMGTTFAAISRDPAALQDTIAQSPSTEQVATDSLRIQRPFLNDTADFSHDLRFATTELRAALPDINPALETGTPVLKRTVAMNQALKGALTAGRDLIQAPGTNTALRGLVATVMTLNPQLKYLGPYQTVCNYWNYFWTRTAEHFSEGDPTGESQRALLNSTAGQLNSTGSAGAFEAANGEGYNTLTPAQKARGDNEIAHGNPYSAAITNSGAADCESGQEGYIHGPLATFAPTKDKEGGPTLAVADPHMPGVQGPTFAGLSHVPPGETFTREPLTGAKLDPALTSGIYGG